jgi:hypothetical protein
VNRSWRPGVRANILDAHTVVLHAEDLRHLPV